MGRFDLATTPRDLGEIAACPFTQLMLGDELTKDGIPIWNDAEGKRAFLDAPVSEKASRILAGLHEYDRRRANAEIEDNAQPQHEPDNSATCTPDTDADQNVERETATPPLVQLGHKTKHAAMYENARTWNPFVGCKFNCIYCKPSFQAQSKRRLHTCRSCYDFAPHVHENWRDFPPEPIIFVCGYSDIAFCPQDDLRKILDAVKEHSKKNPDRTYYLQSKQPDSFRPVLDSLIDSVALVTTLETNRDEGYAAISKAPPPSERYKQFLNIAYPRKIVTIEPVMDFDVDQFAEWLIALRPELIYLGLNNKPIEVQLPEPSVEKLRALVTRLLSAGVKVQGKQLRGLDIGLPHLVASEPIDAVGAPAGILLDEQKRRELINLQEVFCPAVVQHSQSGGIALAPQEMEETLPLDEREAGQMLQAAFQDEAPLPSEVDARRILAKYRIHALADRFPIMQGNALYELMQDIKNNGLLQPIVRCGGEIIDGRNRLVACQIAAVDPSFEEWTGPGTVEEWIISMNIHRRHLTNPQRALIAANLKATFSTEATERSRANLLKAPAEGADPAPRAEGKSAERAATIMQVSTDSVKKADKVLRSGDPMLIAAVEQNAISLDAAAAIAPLPHAQQQQLLKDGQVQQKAKELRGKTKSPAASNAANSPSRSPIEILKKLVDALTTAKAEAIDDGLVRAIAAALPPLQDELERRDREGSQPDGGEE